MSRKRKGAPFSLFAFQDAITSVCGVVVLITLMLALELTRRVADDTPEQNDPVAAQVKELRAKIAAEREDIEALESAAPDAGDAVDPQTAGFSLAEVQTNFENVQKRLEAAKAEEARLRNEREARTRTRKSVSRSCAKS